MKIIPNSTSWSSFLRYWGNSSSYWHPRSTRSEAKISMKFNAQHLVTESFASLCQSCIVFRNLTYPFCGSWQVKRITAMPLKTNKLLVTNLPKLVVLLLGVPGEWACPKTTFQLQDNFISKFLTSPIRRRLSASYSLVPSHCPCSSPLLWKAQRSCESHPSGPDWISSLHLLASMPTAIASSSAIHPNWCKRVWSLITSRSQLQLWQMNGGIV